MEGILLHGLAAILYSLLGFYFWRTRWLGKPQARISPWERLAVLIPFVLHTWLLYTDLFAGPHMRFGFAQALSVTMWLAVLVYWVESLFVDLQGMNAVALPLAGLCAFLPALFSGLLPPTYGQQFEFRAHLVVAMAAYSLFTLAAMHAVLMALLERKLHRETPGTARNGLLGGPWANLPPLLTLETLLFRMLGLGFVLLTLTLISGVLFSESLFHQPFRLSHKTLFASLSWLIFGGLLAGRRFYGWRGRRALRWTLAGFFALLLAYVGSRFVLEVVLSRALT
ncbi:MAG TPA: cytochrome c biogenesis protein CcsA [Burkholderiales bacterium]|nr:cytochrome c biogenesis protein CcsA [Burkholderiales bacterium]